MTTRRFFISSLAVLGLSLAAVAGAQTGAAPKAPAPKAPAPAAQVGPFEVAPHWSPYNYPKSIKEGQAFHMVVRGDTLWDIAGRYLGNPFLWPQIWEANAYIKKARLIYPGDPVVLPSVQMIETAVTQETTTEGRGAKTTEALVLETPEWANLDALINVASTDTVRFAGYISASIEDESLRVKAMELMGGSAIEAVSASTYQYVVLNRGASSGLKAGDLYSTHRRSRVIKHPVTHKKVGYRIETTGVVRIVLVAENSARAVIEASSRETLVKDYLRPLVEVESPLVKRRVVVEGGDLSVDGTRPAGYVVDIADGSSVAATGVTVGLDMGAGSGLAVGRVITVFRQADKSDPVTKRPLGAAVVIAVRENFSVARLVYSREEIVIGDRILVQP
jgi:hypothetical protein